MAIIDKHKDSIDLLKKAIEVEVNHNYIDIKGKKYNFSRFVLNELRSFKRTDPDNPGWEYLYDVFESYATTTLANRIKYIKQLIKYLENPNPAPKKKKTATTDQKPEDVDIMYVKGVGPKVGALLNKVGLYTAYDLLHYYPRKHLDYSERTNVADLEIDQEVTVFGTIKNTRVFISSKRSSLTIVTISVYDGTGVVTASWFHGKCNRFMMERLKSQYPKGAGIILSGKVKYDDYAGCFSIDKAQAELLTGDFDSDEASDGKSLHLARIVPVYSLTENLHVKTLRKAIYNAIQLFADNLTDPLPKYIQEKYNLIDKITAISQVHFPDCKQNLEAAKKRLIFDEFFLVQLRLAEMRKQVKTCSPGFKIEIQKDGLVSKFIKSLPFKLTKGQENAFEEILEDIAKPEPMHRLLQGDVGSGKTVVACLSMLAAVENGFQSAIMAPTEILAEQHYKNFINWLTPLGLSVGLFVGKQRVKARREMRQNLQSGLINIAVGTHALIQDDVEFKNLGLVVIDEQHRFGVKQRTELKNKGTLNECTISPEMLTMTATPIPRTLALTLHGDLDLSIINELPPGRKPIKTVLVTGKDKNKAYKLIRKEVEKGHQAYIVFPLIEESENLSAKAATQEAEKLKETVFPDLNIGLVHGKLAPADKDKEMEKFRDGEYHILVSTTVIEVGVDVPNATVMLIENAERFGLSQLHQLRGRVGRGKTQSYCVLSANVNAQGTRERLEVMEQTNNGFIIAEKDLEIRGPGEFVGTRQSGLPDLILADIVKDANILELARDAAFEFSDEHNIDDFPSLATIIKQKIQEGLELLGSG